LATDNTDELFGSKPHNDIDSMGDVDFSTDAGEHGPEDEGWNSSVKREKRYAKSTHFYLLQNENST
jgi:hypothetical protein